MSRLRAFLVLFSLLIAGALVSGSAWAQSREAYVGGGLALQDADTSDDGMAIVARGGVGLPELSQKMAGNWSAEGEITRSLISPEAGGNDLDITSFGAYALYKFPIQRFHLRGRAGLVFKNLDLDGRAGDDDELDFSAGFGAGYRVAPNVDVTVEYTFLMDDVRHVSFQGIFYF